MSIKQSTKRLRNGDKLSDAELEEMQTFYNELDGMLGQLGAEGRIMRKEMLYRAQQVTNYIDARMERK